jgi:hypothetical protein
MGVSPRGLLLGLKYFNPSNKPQVETPHGSAWHTQDGHAPEEHPSVQQWWAGGGPPISQRGELASWLSCSACNKRLSGQRLHWGGSFRWLTRVNSAVSVGD